VFFGRWLETPIAIKVIRVADGMLLGMDEALLLQKLRHPCICSFFGTTLVDGRFAMVLEYLEGGSLESLLIRRRKRGECLQTYELLSMASEVAAGLAFLHRNSLIHRDVKSANVLLDALEHAKVADFGVSKAWQASHSDPNAILEQTPGQHTVGVGTFRYAAPEIYRGLAYDESIDVYAFGLLLWEMSHNQIAFDGDGGLKAGLKAASGSRPIISLTGSSDMEGFGELIAACWHHDPSARRPMASSAEQLAYMFRGIEGGSDITLTPPRATADSDAREMRTATQRSSAVPAVPPGPLSSNNNILCDSNSITRGGHSSPQTVREYDRPERVS